jgi:hypothetical protein
MRIYPIVLAGMVAVSSTGCATHVMTSGRVVVKNDNVVVDIGFSDRDRELIGQYYKNHKGYKGKTPPGLAKRAGNLPPGLAKRDVLPPGLQGRGLPSELESQLTPLPSRYVRVTVGADLVLMDRNTRVLFDIIYGIAS